MRGPASHTADDATRAELRRASIRLLLMLATLPLLVWPLVRELPLGRSGRAWVFAWLLVILALYWLYAGMGFRPLLLLQLIIFSSAAALLSAKMVLVIAEVHRAALLRESARVLILMGAGLAAVNLGGMLFALARSGGGRGGT